MPGADVKSISSPGRRKKTATINKDPTADLVAFSSFLPAVWPRSKGEKEEDGNGGKIIHLTNALSLVYPHRPNEPKASFVRGKRKRNIGPTVRGMFFPFFSLPSGHK